MISLNSGIILWGTPTRSISVPEFIELRAKGLAKMVNGKVLVKMDVTASPPFSEVPILSDVTSIKLPDSRGKLR